MAFKEISGARTYIRYEDFSSSYEEGEPLLIVEGRYLGQYTDSRYGGARYEIEKDDGEVVVLARSGSLDMKMEHCKPGDLLKFYYNGKKMLGKNHKFAGKFFHDISVFKDTNESEISDEANQEADSQDLF